MIIKFLFWGFLTLLLHTTWGQSVNLQRGGQVSFKGHPFTWYRVDLKTDSLRFISRDNAGQPLKSFQNVLRLFREKNMAVRFLTNGPLYEPPFITCGLYIEEYEQIVALNLESGNGNFGLKPNGVLLIDGQRRAKILKSEDYLSHNTNIRYAIQSGPLLLYQNKLHPKFRENSPNLHIRSGVGVALDGTLVFAINREPLNFHQFASFFRDYLKVPNALYLDGGLSEIYAPEIGCTDLPFGTTASFIVITGH